MLRFLYTVCDLFAGFCAIVSPIAIIHWLMRVIKAPGTEALVAPLNPVFDPLNAILEFFVKVPPLTFQGEPIPTTQGVLACILTMGFFLFNFIAESLKATEQRMDLNRQAHQQKSRLQKIENEQQKKHKHISKNSRIFLHVNYDFFSCPAAGAHFDTNFDKYGGKILERLPSGITLEFASLDQSFQYCLEVAQAIMSYYATLRPIDPQPTYHAGIQAIDADKPTSDGTQGARTVANFAGANQIVFSPDAKALLEAQGLHMRYQFQSIGMYMVDDRQQELFRLFYQKRERNG